MTAQARSALAVAIAAGAVFALGPGVRQSQALFIGPINSATGIGYASISLAFFFSPKTALTFSLFACGIGFTCLSTVPPTVGLVIKLHRMRYMATLFGLVMLSHQTGGFLGAWLGGKVFEANRSYDWMWWADIVLCLFAAAVHLPIREARSPAPAAA